MTSYLRLILPLCALAGLVHGQSLQNSGAEGIAIPTSTNVSWWAGIIEDGYKMPLAEGYAIDVRGDNHQNQIQPLLLSSEGHVVWIGSPFKLAFSTNRIQLDSQAREVRQSKPGDTLREAFLFASKSYFPASGKMPDDLLFSNPQYNTWIELMYDQNQEGILKYAKGIKEHGFPAGVIMIDDNWQEDYGKWDFKPGKFSDPKAMINTLHLAGFKVMLWVCPFVSPDSDVYRELASQSLFVKDQSGQPAIVRWWNGASALLDFTNPKR